MGTQPQTAAEVRQNLAEQLDWRFAERDDIAIAQALQRGEPVDAVYPLNEAGLLDGFFAFLQEAHVMDHWGTFVIAGVHRIFLPAICFLLLYGTRVLFGIESTNALPSLLFSNVAVMSLIGFNAYQVANGMTRRGAKQRTEASPYCLMDPQTLARSICDASAVELERLFNGTIHGLAAFGVFMAEAMVAVDGTKVVTTRHFRGCGCLSVTKRKRTRQGAWVEVVELVFGWRLIALVDLVTLIPIAIQLTKIQCHEAPYLVELIKQAQHNLAPYSRIRTLVVDRAYVDGPSLYALHQMGITFVVIAKSDMAAHDTALALSAQAPVHERVETVRHGHGREARTEELITRVIPVTGIRTWDSYRPPVIEGERLLWTDRPALNAVVLKLWRNQPPNKTGARVYLTNGPVDNPWVTVDAYDDRSWIENGLFRNSKQFLRLTRWFPERTEAGVRSHVTLVMLMTATATAYRLWDKAQSGGAHPLSDHQISAVVHRVLQPDTGEGLPLPEPAHPRLTHLASLIASQPQADASETLDVLAHSLFGGQGLARWRRDLQRENRENVIVFIGSHYGIFEMHAFLVLSGVPMTERFYPLGSREDILRRYNCNSESAMNLSAPDG